MAMNLVNDAALPAVVTCARYACDCCTCCCGRFIVIEQLLASSSEICSVELDAPTIASKRSKIHQDEFSQAVNETVSAC